MAPYVRINREAFDVKKMGGFINDSSYSNACDPNSMRDQGCIRNAIYHLSIKDANNNKKHDMTFNPN